MKKASAAGRGGETLPGCLRLGLKLRKHSAGFGQGMFGWDGRIRTYECQSQSLVPYRLATSQYTEHCKSFGIGLPTEIVNGVGEGIRTLDLQSHNLAR